MSLSSLIVTKILKDGEVTLTQLEHRATERGVSFADLYDALETVHRDKRITRRVKGGEVVYTTAAARSSTIGSSTTWLSDNYPRPHTCTHDVWYTTCEHCMPFPEIRYDGLFLKTKEERDEFKAAMTGRPVYTKSKWQHQRD